MDCFVASGSMFRLCLDLVTKNLLEKCLEENQTSEQQPNKEQRNKLANRIDFLIDQDKIPKRLQELAHCIRHDGNDSAHDGNTGEEEALDCLDFTEALLTEIYTLTAQINEANKRRLERRAKSQIKDESNHMTMRHGCRSFVRGHKDVPLTNKESFVTFAPTKVRYIFH